MAYRSETISNEIDNFQNIKNQDQKNWILTSGEKFFQLVFELIFIKKKYKHPVLWESQKSQCFSKAFEKKQFVSMEKFQRKVQPFFLKEIKEKVVLTLFFLQGRNWKNV